MASGEKGSGRCAVVLGQAVMAAVSVSLGDARVRLICAGWLPQGRAVRLERSAGLTMTGVAR
jgi:hypothetical protein